MNEGSLGHKRMVRKITSLQLQSAKDPDNKKIAGDAYLAYGKGNFKKGFRKNRAKPGSGNYEAEIGKHYIKKASKMREDKVPPLVALKRLLKEAKEKKAYRMGKLGKPSKITDLMRKFRGGTSASKSHDAMQDAEDRADQRAEDRAKDRENIKESGEKRVNRLAARARKTEDPKDAKNAARASSKVWLRKYIKTKNKGKGDSHNAYAQKRNFSDDNRFANEATMSNNDYVNYLAEKIMFFSELLSLNEGSRGIKRLARKRKGLLKKFHRQHDAAFKQARDSGDSQRDVPLDAEVKKTSAQYRDTSVDRDRKLRSGEVRKRDKV